MNAVKKDIIKQHQKVRDPVKPVVQGQTVTIDLTQLPDFPRPSNEELDNMIEVLEHPQKGEHLTKVVNRDFSTLRAIRMALPTFDEDEGGDTTESEDAFEQGGEDANEDNDEPGSVRYYKPQQYGDDLLKYKEPAPVYKREGH